MRILLGIKKDFIRLNEKGNYHWGDVGMHNQFHISNRIRRKAQSTSLDIVKVVQEALSEKEQVLRNSHFICLNAGENYYFDHAMNILEFRPKYFLLYNNICEHSIYDSKFLKILKIVPVKESTAEYMTIEFENEEYHSIQVSHPNYLEFTLRSHTGELIQFHNNQENVIIDLSFKIIH